MFRTPSARRDNSTPEPRRPGKTARPALFLFETREAPDSLRDVASVSVLGGIYGDDFPVARVSLPDLPAPPPAGVAVEPWQDPAGPPAAPRTSDENETQAPADLRLDDPLSETLFPLSLDDDFAAESGFANPFVSPAPAATGPALGGAAGGSTGPGLSKPAGDAPGIAGDQSKFLPPDSSAAFGASSTRVPASDFTASRPATPALVSADQVGPTDLSRPPQHQRFRQRLHPPHLSLQQTGRSSGRQRVGRPCPWTPTATGWRTSTPRAPSRSRPAASNSRSACSHLT